MTLTRSLDLDLPPDLWEVRVTMDPLLIAKGENDLFLFPQMANRHGLVAGVTGTGKTVTLQVIAENPEPDRLTPVHGGRQRRLDRD